MTTSPWPRGIFGDFLSAPRTTLLTGDSQVVRRVFFSFHYQRDIWRIWRVRNHWVAKDDRQAAGYFDGSLSEKAQTEGSAKVKRLIDEGLNGSSVTCVLIGAETYTRHWVDYEIFRSIELGKGVFGVRIHGLKNNDERTDSPGPSPFEFLGYGTSNEKQGKLVPYAKYSGGWKIFEDGPAISPGAAAYLRANTTPVLSTLFHVYDWVGDNGYENFANWVNAAAKQAQR